MADPDALTPTAMPDAPDPGFDGPSDTAVGDGLRGEPGAGAGAPVPWRTFPVDLPRRWRRVLAATLVAQLAFLVSVGIVTALDFHFTSPIDEVAHLVYVQQIAEHGSLPVLGRTSNSWQGLALLHGTYPRPSGVVASRDGLEGLSWEAFQPPLYYVVAVPAYSLTSNFAHKVYVLRMFDVVLLLASVGLAARLARHVLRDRWMIGWSMTLVFFALPGVVVRFVTVSNLALGVPLAILFATELWIAWSRHSTRRLLVAGGLAGLCVLTELELLAVVPVLFLVVVAEALHRRRPTAGPTPPATRRRRPRHPFRPLVAVVLLPVVVVAPWFLFNEAHYHMFTAGPIAIQEQTAIVNPGHVHHPVTQLPDDTVALLDPTLPQEWPLTVFGHQALVYLDKLLAALMVPAGLLVVLTLGRRRLWSVPTAILALPYLLTIVELWSIIYVEQWQSFARYTYPTLPLLLMLVAMATETFRARYLPLLVSAGATIAVMAIWVYLIFVYAGSYALQT